MSIRIVNVSKAYGKTVALRDINLEIAEGEFLSVVGPSGCGKTTLLRIIAGFARPTQGAVVMNDRDVTDIPARRRGIGMVFQHYALFPNLTVYENVAFGLRARRAPQPEVDSKVKALLGLVHMEGKGAAFPNELSGGQQQRVAVARALAVSPKILLLDEPLSALDAKVRLELRYELKRIQREAGITAIYVTHDQEEALSISDRVAVMEDGVIRQIGTPEDIYAHPQCKFVAQFVGVSNLFDASVVSGPEGIVRWGDIMLRTPRFEAVRDSVVVAVRPEAIRMASPHEFVQPIEPAEETGEGSILEGTVLDRVFLGATVRFAVDVSGQVVYVDVQNVGSGRFTRGDRVLLWVGRSAAQVVQ